MGASFCGGRIYFTSTRDGNAEIYSSNADGTDLRRLTDNPGIDVSPACGGPGGTIAFVSNRHGSPQIFGMNSQGGNVRRLTYRGSYNQTPAWCPDAEQSLLAFTGRAGGLDVFTVNIQSQQYTRITQGQGVNKDPGLQPGLPHARVLLDARRHLHREPRGPEPAARDPRRRRDAALVALIARPRTAPRCRSHAVSLARCVARTLGRSRVVPVVLSRSCSVARAASLVLRRARAASTHARR
jgi:hypothetical protein